VEYSAARPVRRAITAVAAVALALSALAWFSSIDPAWADTPCQATVTQGCPSQPGKRCYTDGGFVNVECCQTLGVGTTKCCHWTTQYAVLCYYTDMYGVKLPCMSCPSTQYAAGTCSNLTTTTNAHCDACTLHCLPNG
jgi:hypothetical protein